MSNNTNTDERILERCESLTTELLKRFEGFPNIFPLKNEALAHFQSIREIILSMRPPRIMLVGRCKSGKSSLINAILGCKQATMHDTKSQTGAAKWISYARGDDPLLDILDTRGLQEQVVPLETDQASASTPEKSILLAIEHKRPDVVLLLCKATDVHSALAEDLKICENILKKINKEHSFVPPVIGVLTQCDELSPPYIKKFPTDNERKLENIENQKNDFSKFVKEKNFLKTYFKEVVPTVAYAEYEDGECGLVIEDETDHRWNIDKLIEVMLSYVSSNAKSSLVHMGKIKKFQKEYASIVVNLCSALCGATAASPIPVVGIPIIGTLQTFMLMYIAFISGRPLSFDVVGDFLSSLGVSVTTHMSANIVSTELVKLIPVLGNAISGTTAAGATKAMGEAAIAFFIDQVPSDLVKNIWEGKTEVKVS